MREKKKLWTFIALTLLVGAVMAGVSPVSAQYPTEGDIYMDPASVVWTKPPHDTGDWFTVDLMVRNVTEFWGVVFSVHWDPAVLDWVEPAIQGDCLGTGADVSSMAIDVKDHVNGFLGGAAYMDLAGVNYTYTAASPGWVATLNFTVVGYSSGTYITFEDNATYPTGWSKGPAGPDEQDYDAMEPLYFELPPPPPYGPTVDFSFTPVSVFENDNVTFTATTTPGFNGTDLIAVSEYRWDWEGDLTIDLVTPDAIVVHNYTTAGAYNPFVEVYAGPNPGYETANKSKLLNVYAVEKSYIDVYTELAGSGPNLYGSAFEPGQEITISAELKYNGVLVNNTWVGFQIVDVTGDNVTFRTAITVAGTATIDVRLPLMGTEHLTGEGDFGTFKCIATANVFEEPFNDTVSFYVGWIVDTVDVTATAANRGGSTTVTVNIENYGLEEKTVFLTVTVYDSVGVAIGVYSTGFTISAASYVGLDVTPKTATEGATIPIPSDAWPGPAMVYVNAFDKPPLAGGDAWCSEISATFAIT